MSDGNKPICLFDLDNTLADYQGQMQNDLEYLYSPGEKKFDFVGDPPDWIENRMSIIKRQPGWWKKLPLLNDGVFVLMMTNAMGFEPHILTKGPFKTTPAWEEKVLWVREKIDPICGRPTDITITQDKGLVYGRVLVDDWPPYCERWLEHRPRGLVIMPGRKYNENFKHPQVFRFDSSIGGVNEKVVDQLKQKLQEAYERK